MSKYIIIYKYIYFLQLFNMHMEITKLAKFVNITWHSFPITLVIEVFAVLIHILFHSIYNSLCKQTEGNISFQPNYLTIDNIYPTC